MPSSADPSQRSPIALRGGILLLGILALAVVLRVYRIDALELWHDEANSLFESKGLNYVGNAPGQGFSRSELPAYNTLGNVIDACLFIDSGNASLYAVTLHYWTMLSGEGPGALRMLSVLFGLIGVLLVHRFSRDLFNDRWSAALTAAIMALSPLFIEQSQQLRSYTLAVLLSLWATMLLFRMLRAERPGARMIVLYGLAAAGSMLSHYSTCYILLAHPLVAVIMRAPFQRILRIGAGGVLAITLFMMWMILAGHEGLEQMRVYNEDYVHQLAAHPGMVSFYSATTSSSMLEGWILQLLASTGNDLRFSGPPFRVIALMLIVPFALVAILLYRSKQGTERRTMAALSVLWLSSMVYATVLAIISGHTISFQPHYATFAAPYAALLIGTAIARIKELPRALAGTTTLLGVAFGSIMVVSLVAAPHWKFSWPNEYALQRERLRAALERYQEDKVIAVHSSKAAAYQFALFAGPEADDLPNYVSPVYAEVSGLIIGRGDDRWMTTIRTRTEAFVRSSPRDDHTWHLDYGPAPALPDPNDTLPPAVPRGLTGDH